MAVLIFCLAAIYVYFVNKTVWNIATREKLQADIVAYNSKLGQQEFAYISSKNKVTMEMATSLGFASPERVAFVTREIPRTVAVR